MKPLAWRLQWWAFFHKGGEAEKRKGQKEGENWEEGKEEKR